EQVFCKEMEQGRIRQLPIQVILITFFSKITFPFLARNLIISLFYETEEQYRQFVEEWKEVVLAQMKNLLIP
ncbi:MAG: hypothetical protein LUD68_10315, partial [Rikenellaceae bacterium]|nr:hypothetical protein [Rikenellaceae bacterium]